MNTPTTAKENILILKERDNLAVIFCFLLSLHDYFGDLIMEVMELF